MELNGKRTDFERWQEQVCRQLPTLYHKIDTCGIVMMHLQTQEWEEAIAKKWPYADVEALRTQQLTDCKEEMRLLLQEYNMLAAELKPIQFDLENYQIKEL